MRIRKSDSSDSKLKKNKTAAVKAYSSRDTDGFRHEVELKAYYNFLDRQQYNKPGNEITDWLEAEKAISKSASAGSH